MPKKTTQYKKGKNGRFYNLDITDSGYRATTGKKTKKYTFEAYLEKGKKRGKNNNSAGFKITKRF